ncbi:lipid-A-disaccharide synthase [Deferribacteraceae bacterium V6Fe1]|nr:lipid-A-disaccharide synthase [Deferribacteraceae bacterium V6Fe1]
MKIFLIAGEESADIHGSNMIRHLKKMADFSLYGTGGTRLKSLGQEQYFDINQMTIIGLDEILKKSSLIFNMFKTLKNKLIEKNPDLVILIDYPGFNLRFAKIAKKLGFKVAYYIAPQVWAWHYSRVKKIREYVELVLCILPFEEELFKKEGINAKYVGNPIIDNIMIKYKSKAEFKKDFSLDKKITIGILPGSRRKEINNLMPEIIKAYETLKDKYDFVLARASNVDKSLIEHYTQNTSIKVLDDKNYDVMKYSDLLWICSGTATLEAAILQTPMILLYKVGKITEFLGRIVIKTNFIGLPNIIADKQIIPELIQGEMNSDNILHHTNQILKNEINIKDDLKQLSNYFLNLNPSENAAKEIYSLLVK